MAEISPYKYLPPELADRLHPLNLSVRRPVEGHMQGQHRSPHHGSSVEFAEYREYTRGDPPNLIDWAVYARSDRYVVRRYQEETNLRGFVLLDTSESMAFHEDGLYPKFEYAAYLAAALMYILIRQSDAAGLALFHEGLHKLLPPAGSLEGLRPMLLALEEVKPTGRSRIGEALHKLAERIRSRSLVVLVSDLLREPDEILRGLRHLHHDGHEVMVLHVLDPAELRISFTGMVELKELETGDKLVLQADEFREAYAQAVQRHIETLRRGCTDCLADYHLVNTRRPVEETLQRMLRRL